ncbi:hypothetical protein [Pseudomonas carnis]|uniref:hypothetical protein n=1 Tax=Pseudomonas TaxID=286 RepID=UPI000FDB74EF|nr:hypothetical protein [Pseudomonas carnis]MBJ2209755.1 hypothetical protein [Pseudomonas carnis]
MSNSINNIDNLPLIEEIKRIAQGLALIDAIIMPQWEHRYFSLNCNWDGQHEEMIASMRNGEGEGAFYTSFVRGRRKSFI